MKLQLGYKIQAGTLSYVLSISILVSLAMTLIIYYLFYQIQFNNHIQAKHELILNLETAKFICLNEFDEIAKNKTQVIDLYGRKKDSISILKQSWGIWDQYNCYSFEGRLQDSLAFLCVKNASKKLRAALHLHNDGRAFSVVGNTKLIGDTYLPLAGIQTANIGRIGYTNDSLVYGKRYVSDKSFPSLPSDRIFKEIKNLKLDGIPIDLPEKMALNSFYYKTQFISGEHVNVNTEINGNILIHARNKVVISKEAVLSNVIIYAPTIIIENGFKGQGQFFAHDTIIVEKNAFLTYPSVVYTYNDRNVSYVDIQEGSKVAGWVIIDGDDYVFRQRLLSMQDGSTVEGYIYVNGYASIYGDIIGGITVKKFLVDDFAGIFENYLMNATIDNTRLDSLFPSGLWFGSHRKSILNYLK